MASKHDYPSNVKFRPWVGENYSTPQCPLLAGSGRRLLVLGESHYDEPEEFQPEYTRDIVAKYVYNERHPFVTKIGQALGGRTRDEMGEQSFMAVWSDISFYNYVQQFVADAARARPTKEMWEEAFEPFLDVVRELRPTHVWACGYGLWDNVPSRGMFEKKEDKYLADGCVVKSGTYTIAGTNEGGEIRTKIFRTYHPSSYGKFSWQSAHEILELMLND